LSWLFTKNAAWNLANTSSLRKRDKKKRRKGTGQEERTERKEEINKQRERERERGEGEEGEELTTLLCFNDLCAVTSCGQHRIFLQRGSTVLPNVRSHISEYTLSLRQNCSASFTKLWHETSVGDVKIATSNPASPNMQ